MDVWRWALVALLFAVGGCSLPGSGKAGALSERDLGRLHAQAEADGFPLLAPPGLPEHVLDSPGNAASDYAQAAALLQSMDPDLRRRLAMHTQDLMISMRINAESVRGLLQQAAPSLEAIRRGAEKPTFARYEGELRFRYPELTRGLSPLADLLSLQCAAQADAGDWEAAAATMELLFRLAGHAGQEPGRFALEVQDDIESRAFILMRTLWSLHRAEPESVRLMPNVNELPPPPDLERAVAFSASVLYSQVNGASPVGIDEIAERRFSESSELRKEQVMVCLLGYEAPALQEVVLAEGDLVAAGDRLRILGNRQQTEAGENPARDCPLVVFDGAYLSTWADRVVTLEQRRELNRALAQAIAYRIESGSWPGSLEELPGKPFVDNFTGQTLLMRAFAQDGISIYGRGPDGQDNQGKLSELAAFPRQGEDIVVLFPRFPGMPI